MKYILIPTDFSDNSWNAIEYAIGLFKKEACNFYILHVGKLRQSGVKGNSFTLPKPFDSTIRKKINHLFERIDGLPENRRHHFIALEEYGSVIDSVRKTVDTKNIDLIVMGTKGASALKASIVGSNTGDVITQVACDILVVPEKATIVVPPKNVVFPTDYNIFYSHSILEAITEVLQISNADLEVINISQINGGLNKLQEKNKAYLKDYLNETFPDSHKFITVINGNIKQTVQGIVRRKNVDLVIMVAKNLNFLQQLLFDTTIEKLSFHSTVPLLILHE